MGFLSWLLGNICDGANRMRSTCLPGIVIIFGPANGIFDGEDNPAPTEPGVAIQPGRMAGGSQGPVVKSWVSASRASMPHLVAVDR